MPTMIKLLEELCSHGYNYLDEMGTAMVEHHVVDFNHAFVTHTIRSTTENIEDHVEDGV